MRKTALLILLIGSFALSAQTKFYIEASGNQSVTLSSRAASTVEVQSDKPAHTMYETKSYLANYNNKMGGGVRGGLNYFFYDYLSLDAALEVTNNNFQQLLTSRTGYFYHKEGEKDQIKSDREDIVIATDSNHSMFWVGLPIGMSYYFVENTLAVGVEVTPAYLLGSTGGKGAARDFNKTGIAMQLQLRYRIIPNWWVVAGYREFSSKLYKAELKQSFSSLQDVKVGVRYAF